MKSIKTYALLILVLTLIASCKKDPAAPDDRALAFEKLAGSWALGSTGSIMVDGQDASLNYDGFSMSFTDGGYATINAGDLFNASGTWAWANAEAGEITLDNNRSLVIISLNENEFTFSFTSSGNGGVRAGVAGNYVITVVK
jgi:hypothetical protein